MEKKDNSALENILIYKDVLNNALDGVVILKSIFDGAGELIDFEYVFVNKAAKALLGDGLHGRRILEEFPLHKENGLWDHYAKVALSKVPTSLDFFYGGEFNSWAQISAIYNENGITIFFKDITEQKQYSLDLEKKIEHRTQHLLQAHIKLEKYALQLEEATRISKVGTWEWDLKTNQVTWSEELFRILDWQGPKDNIILDSIFDFVHPEDVERVKKTAERAAREKRGIPLNYRILTQKGEEKHVFGAGGHEVRNETGEVIKLFGVIQDVTELKKTEFALTEALKKEKELSELKSRFVSMASHEFRTPLTTIHTSATLIDKYHDPVHIEKRIKHIRRIESNVQNMRTILGDFLSLSKLEEGKVRVVVEKFNIKDFCQELTEDLQGQAKNGQVLRTRNFGSIEEVVLDKQLLRNICINLLSNAIKYSGEHKEIILDSYAEEDMVKIVVTDQGIGIPNNEQKHMFTRFFRAKNAEMTQGTGLGLTIVHRYVELMKGKISFTSIEDEGSTFTVILPMATI